MEKVTYSQALEEKITANILVLILYSLYCCFLEISVISSETLHLRNLHSDFDFIKKKTRYFSKTYNFLSSYIRYDIVSIDPERCSN